MKIFYGAPLEFRGGPETLEKRVQIILYLLGNVDRNEQAHAKLLVYPVSVLGRMFYARPAADVAHDLLGKILVHGEASGRIIETEAYLGDGDGAAHSAAGLTPRTRIIFGPPGHAYVYFIYGMHNCLNLVAEREGAAGCVLIRAVEPLTGVALMRRQRASPGQGASRVEDLANGPGKLTRAFGITLAHNGADVTRGPITVHTGEDGLSVEIAVSKRIGITKSAELPLRFFVKGNRFVSRRAP